jgi:hypothetical protein
MPETELGNTNPFRLTCDLMIADEKGDYERAAESQRRLAAMGWYVSRKPLEEPAKPKRRSSRPAAGKAVAQ